MNLTKNVNIGGYPFIIDEDAYEDLLDYLDLLDDHFAHHDGAEDIVHDIEMRMAELLQERRGHGGIISRADVRAAIQRLGTPEVLSEDSRSTAGDHQSYERQHRYYGTRKLFRDPESKVIGGVCSGVSQYLGWSSPVWLRLIWAAFVFIGGSGVLLYLILWAIIPAARTASDRLAMQGKPINVNTIATQVEDSVKDITNAIDDIGDQFKRRGKRREEQHY